jgi:hypothetical protein
LLAFFFFFGESGQPKIKLGSGTKKKKLARQKRSFLQIIDDKTHRARAEVAGMYTAKKVGGGLRRQPRLPAACMS